jgi:hypothetical protein
MKLFMLVLLFPCFLFAATPITVMKTKFEEQPASQFQKVYSTQNIAAIKKIINDRFDTSLSREVKAQVIYKAEGQPDHLLVYLLSPSHHKVDVARVDIDSNYQAYATHKDYTLENVDVQQQPGITAEEAACPDDTTELITFCPNTVTLELNVTTDVTKAALNHKIKTVELLQTKATRAAYLNYMSCPNLKGNFYDGDSNPNLFITNDGVITAQDMKTILKDKFRYKVINIWLACQAHNDPMLSAVVNDAQAQKFAAGINDLLIGPSDYAAGCTMKALMDGKAMTPAFDACYKQFDNAQDHWGVSGKGSEYYGQ